MDTYLPTYLPTKVDRLARFFIVHITGEGGVCIARYLGR